MTHKEFLKKWAEREHKHRADVLKADKEQEKRIKELYDISFKSVENSLNAFFGKYATKEGITMAEAKRRAAMMDIEAMSKKAAVYVKNKDFSDQANKDLRLYNLTLRTTRLELLKEEIAIELYNLGSRTQEVMESMLTDTARDELEFRGGGLLARDVNVVRDIVNTDFYTALWSERYGIHEAELQNMLETELAKGIIAGRGSDDIARAFARRFNITQYRAATLVITEKARVATETQRRIYEKYDYEEFVFLPEPTACDICKPLKDRRFSRANLQPGLNAPPMHPRCHCAIAPYGDREKFEQHLKDLGL